LIQSETMTYTHCQNCGRWFNAGINFASVEEFENARIRKTTRVCPFCKKTTPVMKENLRFDEVRIDGRITHTEGKYFL
jgi:ssDNA-binding Zn-finger/Zn-ribbon topoisomerase 1